MLNLSVDQIVNGAVPADWDAFIESLIGPDCYSLSPAECRVLKNGGAVICSSDEETEPLMFRLPDGRILVEGSPAWKEPNRLL